jgi:hypothetical protein
MNLSSCAFTNLRNWYMSQERIIVYWDAKTKYFQVEVIDKTEIIGRADSLMEGMEMARAYDDAMEDITAPEIRDHVYRVLQETAIKIGLPNITDRQKKILTDIMTTCESALGKDRFLD